MPKGKNISKRPAEDAEISQEFKSKRRAKTRSRSRDVAERRNCQEDEVVKATTSDASYDRSRSDLINKSNKRTTSCRRVLLKENDKVAKQVKKRVKAITRDSSGEEFATRISKSPKGVIINASMDEERENAQFQDEIGVSVIDSGDEKEFHTDDELLSDDGGVNDSEELTHNSVDSEINFRQPAKVNVYRGPRTEDVYSGEEEFEDPRMEKYIQKVIDKRWQMKLKEFETNTPPQTHNRNSATRSTVEGTSVITPNLGLGLDKFKTVEKVKSPSDTTLYAPGLNKSDKMNIQDELIEKISDFVEGVRLSSATNTNRRRSQDEPRAGTSSQSPMDARKEMKQAHEAANDLILEADRYKAEINPPKGNGFNSIEVVRNERFFIGVGDGKPDVIFEDDDFFHITCHVEPGLRIKIERGEYVDLERLLVKDRFKRRSEDQALQFYQSEGHAYLAPSDHGTNQINSVRKWEQAFRVYAAIYSRANPSRAAEIWQYVYVINTAAASFIWENVAFYDFTFRHMMAQNPMRSWAKTYTQMWNIAMHEHIQKNTAQTGYFGNGKMNKERKKKDACWRFNRNQKCNAGCDYEHKCSYCNNYSHTVLECHKLKGKRGGGYRADNQSHHHHHKHEKSSTANQSPRNGKSGK